MQVAVLLLRVVLALVFCVAGAAKLGDLDASRDTVEAFGATLRIARLVGTAIPAAELVVATSLLIEPSARWGAGVALFLLAAFSGGVVFALSRGNAPDCNCFGQLSSQQIGPRTLIRNALFAVLAIVILVYGSGRSLGGWTTNAEAASLVAGLAIIAAALSGFAALHLYRGQDRGDDVTSAAAEVTGDATAQRTMLGIGEPAPEFTLFDVSETQVTLTSLKERGVPVLLVFASPICGPCQRLLPQLARWSSSLRDRLVIAVIESTVHDGAFLESYLPVREELVLMYEPGFALSERYGVGQTPTAILIGADGRLASVPHTGAGAIERLVRSSLKQASQAAASAA